MSKSLVDLAQQAEQAQDILVKKLYELDEALADERDKNEELVHRVNYLTEENSKLNTENGKLVARLVPLGKDPLTA